MTNYGILICKDKKAIDLFGMSELSMARGGRLAAECPH